MMSAMPAYAIRKEREKKKSRSKVVGGRGVYQLRPPRHSRNSISSTKGVYKRPTFNRSSQDQLRGSTDPLTAKRRRVPLYYVGTALMCAGLVLVFVSVAINDRNTHGAGKPIRYCGLAFLVTGGLLCLIKVLCFSSQDPQNIVFVRRTDDVVLEETTTPSEDASSNSIGAEANNHLPGQPEQDGFIGNSSNEINKNTLLCVNDDHEGGGGEGGEPRTTAGMDHLVSATSGTTFQMNGLSPSASSQGACSTQVLITPDSVNGAKF